MEFHRSSFLGCGVGFEMHYTAKFRAPAPQPELFQLYEDEEEPGGSRPPCLGEPREPQEKVQQCTVGQLADVVPMVQVLDSPGLVGEGRGGIRWWRCCGSSTCRLSSRPSPKFLPDDVPRRTAVRVTQLAEQLVEVPTNPGYALAVVASKLFSRRELRGILSGQGSTASASRSSVQVVDIPVPLGRQEGGGGPQGSLPVQNPAAFVEQIG